MPADSRSEEAGDTSPPRKRTAPPDTIRAFQDRTLRHAFDQLLRKHGYKIFSRRPGKGPIWEKGGRFYSQRRALSFLHPHEIQGAHDYETLHFAGYT